MPKRKTSFDLSDEAIRLITALAERMGLTKTAVIETLVREAAELEGLRSRANPTPRPAP